MHGAVEVDIENNDNPPLDLKYQSYEIKEYKYYHHSFRSLEKFQKILTFAPSELLRELDISAGASISDMGKKAAELKVDFNFLNRTEVRILAQFE
jgi:hypothetical protein